MTALSTTVCTTDAAILHGLIYFFCSCAVNELKEKIKAITVENPSVNPSNLISTAKPELVPNGSNSSLETSCVH